SRPGFSRSDGGFPPRSATPGSIGVDSPDRHVKFHRRWWSGGFNLNVAAALDQASSPPARGVKAMKPETFAKLIGDYADQIIDGFKSSADNEKYAQVVIDRAIKTRWSASLEHQNFGGTKIREIHYPNQENLGQSADF